MVRRRGWVEKETRRRKVKRERNPVISQIFVVPAMHRKAKWEGGSVSPMARKEHQMSADTRILEASEGEINVIVKRNTEASYRDSRLLQCHRNREWRGRR